MKQFSCGSVVPGCTARFSAETDDEILAGVARHAREEHGMQDIPDALLDKVRAGIVEVA